MLLSADVLNRWGNWLMVIADVILLAAAVTEAAEDIEESKSPQPAVPASVQLDILANSTVLLGDTLSAQSAEIGFTVPPGQLISELAAIDVAGAAITLVGDAVALLAARAALDESLTGAGESASPIAGQRHTCSRPSALLEA